MVSERGGTHYKNLFPNGGERGGFDKFFVRDKVNKVSFMQF